MSISKKIDFAIIIKVKNANPNGDPLNGNRPRTNYDNLGEMSDVCLKRKIRNRLQDAGEPILVQSDDYRIDEYRSIKARYDANKKITEAQGDRQKQAEFACESWFDVRAFGQVLAFKAGSQSKKGKNKENESENDEEGDTSVSIGIRGPVSIQSAFSIEPVDIESLQITKSVNLETNKDPDKKSPDTMGMKHRVDNAIYVTYGSINRQLAEKTGFSDEDAEKLKAAMLKMFENDESSARPAGSMEVLKVIWWTHEEKVLPSAKVHRSLKVKSDGTYDLDIPAGIKCDELDGQ
jgi:CRISPR-associated protein Csd2